MIKDQIWKKRFFSPNKFEILIIYKVGVPKYILALLVRSILPKDIYNYNRSTNSAAFCTPHWMSFKLPFPSM